MTLTSTRPAAAPTTPEPRRRRRRGSERGRAWRALLYVVLSIGAIVTCSPLLWTLVSAFKPTGQILRSESFWPDPVTLDNFRFLIENPEFPRYFLNSVVVSTSIVVANLLLASAVGYALAKLRFPGRRAVFVAVLLTFMIPAMVLFVPRFVTIAQLGLANTYAGMILPFVVTPISVFIMRQFISQLPDELLEAARIDGAGEIRIFARVFLPLCGPALATVGILTFVTSWNALLWNLVVAQRTDMYTLPVALTVMSQNEGMTNYGALLAGSLVTFAPIVVLFLFFQRYFVSGIATTGIK
ncbi:carbohydrate ABC transporter permease [Phycicoccus sp. BSK3Z-2]|uniref:Carbohydrate ABC transporter permease n=1 Tax=Phycicoccus avicenniae TaxID=2828860 RepID=A0A941D5A4_9MICO|nr:carbohydrate ABC transporter permease [Phycicoccus avicenniae]MBR7741701.1 carbohydrate ABC transporter permease [Phycicoccus avicenniae]